MAKPALTGAKWVMPPSMVAACHIHGDTAMPLIYSRCSPFSKNGEGQRWRQRAGRKRRHHPAQLPLNLVHGRPRVRVGRQTTHCHALKGGRGAGGESEAGAGGEGCGPCCHYGCHIQTRPWTLPHVQLPEQHAEGEDVSLASGWPALERLGGKVCDGTRHLAAAVAGPTQPKVCHLGDKKGAGLRRMGCGVWQCQQHIARCQVPMVDAPDMHVSHGRSHLQRNCEDAAQVRGAACETARSEAAFVHRQLQGTQPTQMLLHDPHLHAHKQVCTLPFSSAAAADEPRAAAAAASQLQESCGAGRHPGIHRGHWR
mmetsp:Transcript_17103/g.51143  ORF Transcript_17103/g.51143 Transcript_17103/m.51143 type:complete len:312 (-) Transcript_17103:1382-2317(-)